MLESIAGFSRGGAGRMLPVMRKAPLSRLFAIIFVLSTPAVAQSDPENPQPAPAPMPGAATPSPSGWTAPAQQQPQPPATQPNAAQTYPQQPNNNSTPPANGNAQPQAYSAPTYANTSTRDANNNSQRNGAGDSKPFNSAEEAPKSESKLELPTMSVRVDPFNWLLAGRLGFELESQVWKFISVELVPIFIVNDQPPYLNLNLIGVPNTLRQKSAGIGALAGTSVGVGFWLNGTPMEGYVLRAEITNYSINKDTAIDHVNYVEREFQVMIGQHSKWGPFTIAGTFGIGSMLNKHERCFAENAIDAGSPQTSGCPNSKQMLLGVTPSGGLPGNMGVINLNGWAYPIDLVLRISLGVVF